MSRGRHRGVKWSDWHHSSCQFTGCTARDTEWGYCSKHASALGSICHVCQKPAVGMFINHGYGQAIRGFCADHDPTFYEPSPYGYYHLEYYPLDSLIEMF